MAPKAFTQGGVYIPVPNIPEFSGVKISGIFRNIPEYPEYFRIFPRVLCAPEIDAAVTRRHGIYQDLAFSYDALPFLSYASSFLRLWVSILEFMYHGF